MKAFPMTLGVKSVVPISTTHDLVECDVIKSFLDRIAPNSTPRGYSIVLSKRVSDTFMAGDVFKLIMYGERALETVDDFMNFQPIGQRVEVKHKGQDMWDFVFMEMNDERK